MRTLMIAYRMVGTASMIVTWLALSTQAQSESAIQFHDSLGQISTGKVGWSGSATAGHVFIATFQSLNNTPNRIKMDSPMLSAIFFPNLLR